jgi:hypothetical protein
MQVLLKRFELARKRSAFETLLCVRNDFLAGVLSVASLVRR